MKIKLAIITKNNEIIDTISHYLKTNPEVAITILDKDLSEEDFFKQKFDVVIFDKKINSKWLKVFEKVKFANINTIFVLIVDEYSIEEIKEGFKKGIYEILIDDINSEQFFSSLGKAVYSAKIFKSTEKVNKFCEHIIKFTIPSDVNLVNETVMQIIETAKLTGFIKDQSQESNLRLIYTEAIVNAIVHGNKSDKNKKVNIEAIITNKYIKLSVEDEGKGYNVKEINNPLDEKNLLNSSGRGIYLIKSIANELIFENNGKKITIINKQEV